MEEEITLSELLAMLKRHFGKIILWSLVGITIAGIYTFFVVTPQYQSTSKIVVNQTQNTGNSITNTDIQTNLSLINTYQSIIREPIILEDVIETTDSNLTVGQLAEKISVQTQDNSLVFGMTVTDQSPYISSELANAIANSFESKIGDILEVESVTILSQAEPNMNAVSPNTMLNLLLGTTIGLMFGVGIAFVTELMDKRVKDSKIIDDLGWTNLGTVLEMSTNEIKESRMRDNLRIKNSVPSISRRRVQG